MFGQDSAVQTTGLGGLLVDWNVSIMVLSVVLVVRLANVLIGIAAYILLWPEDGRMYKDEIRGIYDGTIFSKIAEARAQKAKM